MKLGRNKMAKSNEFDGQSRNHIATGTKISGDIDTNGDIRIDGELTGSITSTGKVVIGETGKIDGEIKCQNANISGTVIGQLSVDELLSLQASARIHGDIKTGKMSVEPGANFTGSCDMGAVIKDIAGNNNERREKTA